MVSSAGTVDKESCFFSNEQILEGIVISTFEIFLDDSIDKFLEVADSNDNSKNSVDELLFLAEEIYFVMGNPNHLLKNLPLIIN